MLTDLQHRLLETHWIRVFFDVLYLLLPLLLVCTFYKKNEVGPIIAIFTAFFNMVYNYNCSMMTYVSIEGHVGWMLIPFIFIARKTKDFYFLLQVLRIFFICFFFSSALWKIRAGGILNYEQMSAILLLQHNQILANDKLDWYGKIITYFVSHKNLSYILYLLAFISEFVFAIGFFTKKMDKYLIGIFCLFLFSDYLIMGINYFAWLPFMGCFYFSRYAVKYH